jgi:hypothetical protein
LPRLSQQWKDGLTVVITIGVGAATGFFVDERTKRETYAVSLVSLIVLALAQLFLTFFVPSKEATDLETASRALDACGKELEVYRRGERIVLETRDVIAEQTLMLVKQGRLAEALKWHRASSELVTGKRAK